MKVLDIVRVSNGELINGDLNIEINDFSTDSRVIDKDNFFISIVGEKFNGNDFIDEVFLKGACGVLFQGDINNSLINKYPNKIFIKVDDTIKALQEMAKFKRSQYNVPVVAITGSVGKTSTKDLVSSVMSKRYNVLKTEGNLNNHIGLPLTLLKLKDHDAMCIEMGMNHFGELSLLTDILKPTIAVITNVGTAHIGNLGSRENILKAKLEILEGLSKGGRVIINNDNDLLHEWCMNQDEFDVDTYGIINDSKVKGYDVVLGLKGSNFKVGLNNYDINVPGNHFVYNSLCAITVGKLLDIGDDLIKSGIRNFILSSGRMEERKIDNNITLLVDCYNANYDSMVSAIEVLGKYEGRKIAVLGDMLELGDYSKEYHTRVGEKITDNNVDILITVGKESKNIIVGSSKKNGIFECQNNSEAIDILKELIKEGDIILFKASNSMKFIEIVNSL